MIALIIILALLAVILLLPVGVEARYEDKALGLAGKIGPARLQILPRRPEPAWKKLKKEQKKEQKREKRAAKEKKPPDIESIRSLMKPALRALGRFRRRLNIDYLSLRYVAAARDPCSAAMQYGYVSASIGSLLGMLEGALNIEEKDISIKIDFERETPEIEGQLTAVVIIWQLLAVAVAFGIEYLLINHRQRRKTRAAERKDKNGKSHDNGFDGRIDEQYQRDGGREHGGGRPHHNA